MASEMEVDDSKAHWDQNLQYYCTNSTGEINHDWDFTIVCNSKHFIITVSPSLPEDPITSLLTQYSKTFAEDDDDKIQEAQDEILDLVFRAGWQKFKSVAPPILEGDSSPRISTKNLHSDLKPETFYFRLVMTGGNAEIIQMPPHPPQVNSLYLNLKDKKLDLPQYSARDITVTSRLMGLGYIAKVSIHGVDMCCKIATPQSSKAVQREYDCLRQIAVSKNAAFIAAPKLLGLVVDDDGVPLGILEEFIANKGRLSDVVKNEAGVLEERRAKWEKQIREAVALLHEIDVVWGMENWRMFLSGVGVMTAFWWTLEVAIRMVGWIGP